MPELLGIPVPRKLHVTATGGVGIKRPHQKRVTHARLIRPIAAEVLEALAGCVTGLLDAATSGAHVPVAAVDEAQDAIGAAYSLLQLHAPWLASGRAGPAAHRAIAAAGQAMLALMQV